MRAPRRGFSMISPKAALRTSPDPSIWTARNNAQDDIPIATWGAAVHDKSEPGSRKFLLLAIIRLHSYNKVVTLKTAAHVRKDRLLEKSGLQLKKWLPTNCQKRRSSSWIIFWVRHFAKGKETPNKSCITSLSRLWCTCHTRLQLNTCQMNI